MELTCSCDSEYMVEVMKKVGKVIQDAFLWIPWEEICYLFMDKLAGTVQMK